MKIRKVDGSQVRDVITGLIVSDEFCKAILPILSKEPLLIPQPYARTVVKWVDEFYRKFGNAAPLSYIQDIFEQERRNGLQADQADLIGEFLTSISEEYERREEFNIEFEIDRAIRYLRTRQYDNFQEDCKDLIQREDLDGVEQLIKAHRPIVRDVSSIGGMTGDELYKAELGETTWLVEDLIPSGLTLLAGKSKAGKSVFALNLAMHIAKGTGREKAFGLFSARRGRVLYISLEDKQHRLQDRMRAIQPDGPSGSHLIEFHFEWPHLTSGGLGLIENWLEKHKYARLVIIDIFEKVRTRSRHTSTGTLYGEDYATFGPLSDLCYKYDTNIMLLTHTIKSTPADIFDGIYGSMGTLGPMDTLIVIAKQSGQPDMRTVAVRGKDVEDRTLAFNAASYKWACEGDAEDYQASTAKQRIIDSIREMGRLMSNKEIKEAHPEIQSVDMILSRLQKEGHLLRAEKGVYGLPHMRYDEDGNVIRRDGTEQDQGNL